MKKTGNCIRKMLRNKEKWGLSASKLKFAYLSYESPQGYKNIILLFLENIGNHINPFNKSMFFVIFSWQPESKFLFSQIRLPPETTQPASPSIFSEGMEVEVYSRSNERESCGWWAAAIKMMKGEFFVVEYLGWDNSYTEIVSHDRLRPKNPNSTITNKNFFRFEVQVPDDLREYAKIEGVHKEFQKSCGAGACRYDAQKGLLVLISGSEAVHRRVSMMHDMHFRNLAQKAFLMKKTEEAARQLESTKLHITGG